MSETQQSSTNVTSQTSPIQNHAGDPRLQKALQELKSLLVPNENLEAYAVERIFFPIWHNLKNTIVPLVVVLFIIGLVQAFSPIGGWIKVFLVLGTLIVSVIAQLKSLRRRTLVAVTTNRFIGVRRNLLGGYVVEEIRWQDFKDARIKMGIFSAKLEVEYYVGHDRTITANKYDRAYEYLDKDEAQNLYRLAQIQELAWREKRRIRELEELRATSGGYQIGIQTESLRTEPDTIEPSNPTAKLQRAKEMMDKGLISDSEYEVIKAKVINAL